MVMSDSLEVPLKLCLIKYNNVYDLIVKEHFYELSLFSLGNDGICHIIDQIKVSRELL